MDDKEMRLFIFEYVGIHEYTYTSLPLNNL